MISIVARLLVAAALVASCAPAPRDVPQPALEEATFGLPTAPQEVLPTEPPPGTIPPGFAFPVPAPLTEGNADIYAQRALFLRTGSLCFTHLDVDGGIGEIDFEAMATKLPGPTGRLEDGRSYVGRLSDALPALDLEATGIEVGSVAYGIGVVKAQQALPQLTAGTVWAPRLERLDLADGRSGWTLSGPWFAVVPRECSVLPTTPG